MAQNDYIRGYKVGVEKGRKEALVEFQKTNTHHGLPSNDALNKIFGLLFEYRERNRCSAHFNEWECYRNYITEHWNDKKVELSVTENKHG